MMVFLWVRFFSVLLLLGCFLSESSAASLRLGMALEPPGLDPTVGSAGAVDEIVYANIFEGLTRINAEGKVIPALASHWEMDSGGSSYLFHLRADVQFHDGTSFGAEDVKFSLDRARSSDSANGQKFLFTDITEVEIVDPLTVKITLSRPNRNFPYDMAWGDALIVASETAAYNSATPVGTGPFRFEKWVKGDRVVLVSNPHYWGEKARLDKVVFRFISDPYAAFAALMSGQIDAFPQFPAPEFVSQFRKNPRLRVVLGTTEGEVILAINNARPPFDRVEVRKAIAHAVDREALIKGAMFGLATPIGSHFAPHHPAYVDLTGFSRYDPEQSRALLSSAGFPEGFETTLVLPPTSYARRSGEILAEQLHAVGIRATITNVEWGQWLNTVFSGKDFDLTIIGHTEAMDIGIYARPSYYFQYESAAFQELMERVRMASGILTDSSEYLLLLQEAQRRIAMDYVNAYLFQLPRICIFDSKLRGLWVNAPVQANDVTRVYWESDPDQ